MYRCPKCHDADNLMVTVMTSARLTQSHDENFETDVVGDHEWDNQSTMWCTCGFCEAASAFDTTPPKRVPISAGYDRRVPDGPVDRGV